MPSELPVTTPIDNLLQWDSHAYRQYSAEYLAFSRSFPCPKGARHRDLVKIHQANLGRQTTVFLGEDRMWVWVRPTWTVFVGNSKGICFEVPSGTTPEKALEAWRDYRKAMGR